MFVAALALGLSVVVGTVAHELSHAIALRWFGIPHEIHLLPSRDPVEGALRGGWARVTHHAVPADLAPWKLRVAAMMPLSLLIPLAALPVAAVDPISTGTLPFTLAIVGWMACALPSPSDFAIFWHPEESIARSAAG